MIQGLYSNLNALNKYTGDLAKTSSNIANINTPGYKSNSVGADSVEIQTSGVDLGKEMTDMIVEQRGFEANIDAIRTQDEMIGTIIDLKA